MGALALPKLKRLPRWSGTSLDQIFIELCRAGACWGRDGSTGRGRKSTCSLGDCQTWGVFNSKEKPGSEMEHSAWGPGAGSLSPGVTALSANAQDSQRHPGNVGVVRE